MLGGMKGSVQWQIPAGSPMASGFPTRSERPARPHSRPTARLTLAPVARDDGPLVATIGVDEERLGAIASAARDLGLEVRKAASAADLSAARLVLVGGEGEALADLVASAREPDRPVAALLPRHDANRAELVARGAARLLPPGTDPQVIAKELATLESAWSAPPARVVTVQDDPDVLNGVRALLAPEGFEVIGCGDPADLHRLLEAEQPDAVILDAGPLGTDRLEACRTLRSDERWRRLPVLALTATSERPAITALFEAGIDDYVSRTPAGPELVTRVRSRIEQAEVLRHARRVDPATNLLRRSACISELEGMQGVADRLREPLAIAVVKVQGARRLATTHGEAAADTAIRQAGETLSAAVGPAGVVGHFDGDLLVGALGLGDHDARAAMGSAVEQVRSEGPGGVHLPVRLAAGLGEYPHDGSSLEEVRETAERAAAVAVAEGGDRVASATAASLAAGPAVDVALIDDDAVFAEPILEALRTRGYRTRWITDGEEAAQQLAGPQATVRAPLVLLAWELPGRDGLMVLRTLAETGGLNETRVLIMVNGRYTNGETLRALELGAHDHLSKPVEVPALMRKVRLLLGG